MVITIVCDVLGKENNGTSIAAMNLIRSLKAKGHDVRVICPDSDKAGEPGYYIVPTFSFGFLNDYVKKNGVALAKVDKLIVYRAIRDADVVHVMIPFALGHYAAKLAKELGKPVTAGFHCQAENFTNHIFMMNLGIANHIAYKVFYHNLYRYCDYIHYPTQFICRLFEKEVGPTDHYIISNGVNKAFTNKPAEKPEEFKDKFVIVFTGRYSKEKSHKVLINGVSRSKHSEDIQLIFAGDGPRKEHLIRYARKKLPVQPVFRFFSRDELVNVLNYADLYVHPAEIEIEAIACLEAISCGLVPVISDSRRSATKYFALDEKNLFRCNDSADLARKIDYWIEHPEEKKACSENYLGYAGQFDFDRCMDKMEGMLKHAVCGEELYETEAVYLH